MSYVVKRETTGRVGRCKYDHRILSLKEFPTWDEAVAEAQARKREFSKPKYCSAIYGPDDDYYVVLRNEHYDCVDRYFIDQEQVYDVEETFTLNKVESKRLHEFVEKHRQHGRSGSAGEFVRVYFCPTGLGAISHAQCLVCGKDEDLTDYDAW